MKVRRAKFNDAEAISKLVQAVTDQNPNNYSEEQIVAWTKFNTPSEILNQLTDRVVFCAFQGKDLVGTIALRDDFILGFYVNNIIRKTGVGTYLLKHLENYAYNNDIKSLQLTSTPSAIEFYQNRGYNIKENVILSIYGIEYPEVLMHKELS